MTKTWGALGDATSAGSGGPAEVATTLVPVDTTSALAVSDYLDRARQWLATAVEMTGPAEIASARAEIATAAEATKQLGLSKEIQLDATEMVRRAEFALAKSIRKGQAEGAIATTGQHTTGLQGLKSRVPDFIPGGASQTAIFAFSDGVSGAAFEAAIAEAKAEGTLSREAVTRKIKHEPTTPPTTREGRAVLIEDLALQGYTSRQMPERVGVSEETIREIARAYDVEIPADRTSLKTRRINPAGVVENTATALEGLVMGIGSIDVMEIDPALASQWVDSLTESMRALNRFVRQLKEQTQ